ncbi:MAG: DnaA/Hda family protein [Chitinivibrionia bacterium]|nr:DnaA/Hda family protein [Chitinivibrionia bacterium]
MSAALLMQNLSAPEETENHNVSAWSEIVCDIKEIGKKTFLASFIERVNLLRIENDVAFLSVPSDFHKTLLEGSDGESILLEKMNVKFGNVGQISLEIVEDESAKEEEENLKKAREAREKSLLQEAQARPISQKQTAPKSNLHGNFYENYKFDSFVVCDTNKKAFDLCLTTAEMPQSAPEKILVIHGKSGVGKTHLLQAIGHFTHQENTAKNIHYTCAIDFLSEYVNWQKEKKGLDEFYNKFRDVDLLLIDDVHLFRGQGTQNAFFEILTFLYDDNRQIVLTSDCTPTDIPDMIDVLKMRLSNSVAVEILTPSKKNRMQIIKKKFYNRELKLSEDVLAYLADIPTTNIRELEGLYNRLLASSVFCNADLGIDSVKMILNDYIKDTRRITADIILDRVCSYFGIAIQEIRSSSRVQDVAYSRSVAMHLIRTITKNSEQAIGNLLGRDHSTVCITCKKIAQSLNTDEKLQKDIDLLTKIITGQS